MKKALILGYRGNFGGHMAKALLQQGWQLRALLRSPAAVDAAVDAAVECVHGDVADLQTLRQAAQGVDLMVYGISPAGYDWENKALPWLENAATVAEELGLTLVFPGNVYIYDPADGPTFTESSRHRPPADLGRIRVAMEQRLQTASTRGARVIVLRAGDFIGTGSPSNWINHLIKKTARGYQVQAAGPRELIHTWAYLPDVARTLGALIERRQQLPAYAEFNYHGYRASFTDLASAMAAASGKAVTVSAFPWWFFRLLAPVSVLFRNLVRMRYLWQREINLDDSRLRALLGTELYHTPLPQALRDSGLAS